METKEYMVKEMTKTLKLSQEQICVMAALLGNFLLSESSLQDLYRRIGLIDISNDNKEKADMVRNSIFSNEYCINSILSEKVSIPIFFSKR